MKPKRVKTVDELGLLLVEIVLAVAIFGLISLIVLSAFIYGRDATAMSGDSYDAAQIANAAVEAVNNIAQNSYANLANYTDGTTYYLSTTGNQWSLTTTPTTMGNIFTPTIVFSSGPNGSTKLQVTVSWRENAQESPQVTTTTYITDWTAAT